MGTLVVIVVISLRAGFCCSLSFFSSSFASFSLSDFSFSLGPRRSLSCLRLGRRATFARDVEVLRPVLAVSVLSPMLEESAAEHDSPVERRGGSCHGGGCCLGSSADRASHRRRRSRQLAAHSSVEMEECNELKRSPTEELSNCKQVLVSGRE